MVICRAEGAPKLGESHADRPGSLLPAVVGSSSPRGCLDLWFFASPLLDSLLYLTYGLHLES